jgi:lactoylglutathione lyase
MIKHIATQAVYVSDQAVAEDFWTNKVGFEVRAKQQMAPSFYWLEVAPPGAETRIVLFPRAMMPDWEVKAPSIMFECDDVDATYENLKRNGVEMASEPNQMPYGRFASFKDPDGAQFLIRS